MKFSLSSKTVIVIAGDMLCFLTAIAASMLLVRLLTKVEYGTYNQVWLVYGILSPAFVMELPMSIYYFVPRLHEEKWRAFIFQTMMFLLLLGIALSITHFFLASSFSSYFRNSQLLVPLRVFSLYGPFAIPFGCLIPLLLSIDKQAMSAVVKLISSISLHFLVLSLFLLQFDLSIVFAFVVLLSAIQLLFAICYINHVLSRKEKILFAGKQQLLAQLRYSAPLGLSKVLGSFREWFDKIIVSLFFTPTQFAIYTVAAKESPAIILFTYAIGRVLLPQYVRLLSNNEKRNFLRLWHKAISKIALVIFPSFLFLEFFAEQFITFLYTKEYADSIMLFRIYILTIPLFVTNYGIILQAMGKTLIILKLALISLTFNIVLNITLVKSIGFTGPSIAYVTSIYLITPCYLYLIKRELNCNFLQLLPWHKISIIFLFSLIGIILTYPVLLLNLPSGYKLFIGLAIFVIVYLFLLLRFKTITKTDFLVIKEWIHIIRK